MEIAKFLFERNLLTKRLMTDDCMKANKGLFNIFFSSCHILKFIIYQSLFLEEGDIDRE